MELEFNVRALRRALFLVPGGAGNSPGQKCAHLLSLLSLTCVLGLVLAKAARVETTLGMVLLVTFVLANGAHSVYRRLYFSYRRGKLEEIIEMIETPPDTKCPEFDSLEREMRAESAVKVRRFSKAIFTYVGIFITIMLAAPILGSFAASERYKKDVLHPEYNSDNFYPLYYEVWLPWNPHEPPTYYFVLVWQMFTLACSYTNVTVTNGLICSLILATAERSSFLARTAPVALLPGPRGEVTPKFRAWLTYHQHYLRLFHEVNKMLGPSLLLVHFVYVINIIFLSFCIITVDELAADLMALAVIVTDLLQPFTFALAGQQLFDQSARLSRSVLGGCQVARGGLGEGPARSALGVLVTRVAGGAAPEEVSAGGYFPVNMETFNKVLSASVSYLLVLLHFE